MQVFNCLLPWSMGHILNISFDDLSCSRDNLEGCKVSVICSHYSPGGIEHVCFFKHFFYNWQALIIFINEIQLLPIFLSFFPFRIHPGLMECLFLIFLKRSSCSFFTYMEEKLQYKVPII